MILTQKFDCILAENGISGEIFCHTHSAGAGGGPNNPHTLPLHHSIPAGLLAKLLSTIPSCGFRYRKTADFAANQFLISIVHSYICYPGILGTHGYLISGVFPVSSFKLIWLVNCQIQCRFLVLFRNKFPTIPAE